MGETVVHPAGYKTADQQSKSVNYEDIIRRVCRDVGYDNEESKGMDYKSMTVLVNVVPQSQEIFDAVHKKTEKLEDFGAGDQGLMFGYATDEWDQESLHPISH